MAITVEVTQTSNQITVETSGSTVSVPAATRTVSINNSTVPSVTNDAATLPYTPTGSLTGETVQEAIDELAGNDFRSDNQPSGAQVAEGDTWYDTDDNQYKIYRETSSGVFQWVPIMVGSAGGDSDTMDAGAF